MRRTPEGRGERSRGEEREGEPGEEGRLEGRLEGELEGGRVSPNPRMENSLQRVLTLSLSL